MSDLFIIFFGFGTPGGALAFFPISLGMAAGLLPSETREKIVTPGHLAEPLSKIFQKFRKFREFLVSRRNPHGALVKFFKKRLFPFATVSCGPVFFPRICFR